MSLPTSKPTTQDLWLKALESLDPTTRSTLNLARTAKLDVLAAVLRTAEEKRALTFKRHRWVIHRSRRRGGGGGDIVLRDVLEKLIVWIARFRDAGDVAVQFSPGHAALPWAAVRFVLQAAVGEAEVHADVVEGLETVARLVARFGEVEEAAGSAAAGAAAASTTTASSSSAVTTSNIITTASPSSPNPSTPAPPSTQAHFEECLVGLYAAILEFLAEAIAFFRKPVVVRMLRSPLDGGAVARAMATVEAREAEVLKLLDVSVVRRLLGVEARLVRLAEDSLEVRKTLDAAEHAALLAWLSPVPYPIHHRDRCGDRVPDTGDWLFDHAIFLTWATSSESSVLLLHGIPGSGKSSVFSAVVDRYIVSPVTQVHNFAPVACFYCAASSFEPERSRPEDVLRSLVRQLTVAAAPAKAVHPAVAALYEQKKIEAEGFEITRLSLLECVTVVLDVLENNPAYLAVDAIDELERPKDLLDALHEIKSRSKNVVKIFLTSRDNSPILAMTSPAILQLRIGEGDNQINVRKYTVSVVDKAIDSRQLLLGNVSDDLRQLLIDWLCSGAGEMFLWVKLQMKQVLQYKHEKDLRKAVLESKNIDITGLFGAVVEQILQSGDTARAVTTRAFAWLLYMREPLPSTVFLSAVSRPLQVDGVDVEGLINMCHNLIYLDTSSNMIRFAHYSIQEYLRGQSFLAPDIAQRVIASSCVGICSEGPLAQSSVLQPTEDLYHYATTYWAYHCAALEHDPNAGVLFEGLNDFLFDGDDLSPSAVAWMAHVRAVRDSVPLAHPEYIPINVIVGTHPTPMFSICVYGLSRTLSHHDWDKNLDWDQLNDRGQTALYLASYFGHHDVVEFQLSQGTDVNIECGTHGSALHCASFRGFTYIARLLLRHGAQDSLGKWKSAIHAACKGDREETVLSLLQNDEVKPTTTDQIDSLAQVATEAGFAEVLETLSNHPLSAKPTIDKATLAATKAITKGKLSTLKLLQHQNSGTNVLPQNALVLSAFHGHEHMVAYLVDQGIMVDASDTLGTPLSCASLNGHLNICRILLDKGADINFQSPVGGALHAACLKGHLHVVQGLLQAGADVDIEGGSFGRPVQAAAFHGHVEIVKILIDAGANLRATGLFRDALVAAFEGRSYPMISIILNHGFIASQQFYIPTLETLCEMSPRQPRNILVDSPLIRPESNADDDVQDESDDSDSEGDNIDSVLLDRNSEGMYFMNNLLTRAIHEGKVDLVECFMQLHSPYEHKQLVKAVVVEAARYGHSEIIQMFPEVLRSDSEVTRKALVAAAWNNHASTFDVIIGYLRDSTSGCETARAAVLTSYPSVSIFVEALRRAEGESHGNEMTDVLSDCLWHAAGGNHVDTLEHILNYGTGVADVGIVDAFEHACASKALRAVKCLLSRLPPGDITNQALNDSILRAIDRKRKRLAIILIEFSLQRNIPMDGPTLTACAASRRCPEILSFYFISRGFYYDVKSLNQSLLIAAMEGHAESCSVLLRHNANTNVRSELISPATKVLRTPQRRLEPAKSEVISPAANVPRTHQTSFGRSYHVGGIETKHDTIPLHSLNSGKREFLTAVHGCVRGFNQVSYRKEGSRICLAQRIECMRLILESDRYGGSIVLDKAFYEAIVHCPPEVVELMMEHRRSIDESSELAPCLEMAAKREHLHFPIIKLLLNDCSDSGIVKSVVHSLLAQSLDFFQPIKDPFHRHGGLFALTPSLSDVFETGPGATILWLIRVHCQKLEDDVRSAILLQMAAAANRSDLIRAMLSSSIDVNTVCEHYGTALQAASHRGHAEIVKMLLVAGANPNIVAGNFNTALQAAVDGRHLEVVRILIKHGVEMNPTTQIRRYAGFDPCLTPLTLAIKSGIYAIAHRIIRAGADPNWLSDQQPSALIRACLNGSIRLVRRLLSAGAAVQAVGRDRMRYFKANEYHDAYEIGSAAHAAIHAGRLDILEILLDHGFNPSADFGNFRSPLVLATEKGNTLFVDRLLQSMPDATVSDLSTSLEIAAGRYNVEMVDIFLAKGALVFHSDLNINALRAACRNRDVQVLDHLLENVARSGHLQEACENVLQVDSFNSPRHLDIILTFVGCPTDVFVRACESGHSNVVAAAMRQRIDVDKPDSKGRTALDLAMAGGHSTIVQQLLAARKAEI